MLWNSPKDKLLFSFLKDFDYFYFMYVFCLHVCKCNMCMPSTWGDQKRVLGHLELWLLMVVSLHVGVRNQTQIFYKNS